MNEFGQNTLLGLLKPFVRRLLTTETSHPLKEEKESTVMGAGGGVCIIVWEAEHGRRRRR